MKAEKFLAVFCFVLISGLQIFAQAVETPKPVDPSAVDLSEADKTKAAATPAVKNESEENYRIGFQDALEIRVAKHEDLTAKVRVSADGTILLPRLDEPVVAICKTELELKQEIETLYKNYLKRPYVSVSVTEYRSQFVAVTGAVEKPGSLNLNRKVRLLELLSYAGGPDVEFAGAKVQVARLGSSTACRADGEASADDDKVDFYSYKLIEVQEGKVNPWIEPGDMVTVLVAEEAYVVGDVGKPTKVSLRETVTLTQAIAAAGGIGSEAKTSKIRIQRQQANSPVRTELIYDLKEINAQKISDPVLQANDIVEVPKNGVKAARNGILKALSGGLGGLFMRPF